MDDRLNKIAVASPCSADWNRMTGSDQVRYCSQCNLNVYNLSAMSHSAALELVSKREGRLCVRFYQRKDGTVLAQDCPRHMQILKARVSRVAGGAFSAIMGAFPLIAQTKMPTSMQIAEREARLDLTVVDVTGAPCAGARVQIIAKADQQVLKMTTDSSGMLRVSHLLPGIYHLKADFSQFKPYESEIVVEAGKPNTAKAVLDIAVLMGEVVQVMRSPEAKGPTTGITSTQFVPAPITQNPAEPKQNLFHRVLRRLRHPFTK